MALSRSTSRGWRAIADGTEGEPPPAHAPRPPAPEAVASVLPLLHPDVRSEATLTPAGYLDLLQPSGRSVSTGAVQDLMLTGTVPRVYERWWRPALGRLFKGLFGPGMRDEHRIARLLLGLSPGDGILDVACGTGNFTRGFAATVGEAGLAAGIDVSETMLARAVCDTRAAGIVNAAFVRGDAQELPFRDHSFDAVCCFAALHLFADPMRALDRMTAVLTPGGRIALFTTARSRSAPVRTAESVLALRSGARLFEQREVVDALKGRGYIEIRQRVTGITQFVGGTLP